MTIRHTVDSITSDALDQLYERLADYENRITWHTTCGSCARVLDSAIRETERAARAEVALARVRAVPDHPLAQPAPPDHEQVGYVKGWMAASAAYLAALGEPPAPAPAATQATDDGDCCGAEPPSDGSWGDCWCTLQPGHDGEHRCQPCTDRHGAPGWTNPARPA